MGPRPVEEEDLDDIEDTVAGQQEQDPAVDRGEDEEVQLADWASQCAVRGKQEAAVYQEHLRELWTLAKEAEGIHSRTLTPPIRYRG